MSAAEPRQHHFLPECYLSGFTESGDRDGFLHVIGVRDGKKWKGKPATVGSQRDFYRADGVEGFEPSALETTFAEFEGGKFTSVLKSVAAHRRLPEDDDDFSYLISFVALMVARVPRTRDAFTRPIQEITKKMAQMMVTSEARFRETVERARAAGAELPDSYTYEVAREFIEQGEYTIEVNQPYQLKQLLQIQEMVFELLAMRHWSVLVAEPGAEFVTSDNPVVLAWSDGRARGFYAPGFGLPGTDVTFALTKHVAMLGRLEELPNASLAGSRRTVATINARTGEAAARFIAYSGEDVVWLTPENQVGGTAELLTFLRSPRSGDGVQPSSR
jgi:hypothetical protein